MIEFAAETGAVLQLIELEAPREMTETAFFRRYFYPLRPVERELERRAVETRERRMHRRKKYFVPTDHGIAEVEVVRAMHNTELHPAEGYIEREVQDLPAQEQRPYRLPERHEKRRERRGARGYLPEGSSDARALLEMTAGDKLITRSILM